MQIFFSLLYDCTPQQRPGKTNGCKKKNKKKIKNAEEKQIKTKAKQTKPNQWPKVGVDVINAEDVEEELYACICIYIYVHMYVCVNAFLV